METPDVWQDFRERIFPRLVGNIQGLFGREIPVEVDWESLGTEPRLDEALEYDLEMLARGLDAVDRYSPWVDARHKVDPLRIRHGIERVQIRRVRRPEDCRLVVEGGTLQVHFRWEGTGRFSAREVEALLLDREGEGVRRWVEDANGPLPPRLDEVRRNRLPALLRAFEVAMGHPLPVKIEWEGLDTAADAPSRLVHLLGELARALAELVKTDPGIGPLSEAARDRLLRRAMERRQLVLDAVLSLRVSGGRLGSDPVCTVSEGVLRLFVYQDERDEPAGTLFEFRKFPGCTGRQLQEQLSSLLDLEIGPLLRQMRDEELPKAAAELNRHLDEIIGKCSFLSLRERHGLRRRLNSDPIALEVDWNSVTALERVEDRRAVLQKLETGPYVYNRDRGELFNPLFYALEEAFCTHRSFPVRFLDRVRAIRYEMVADPSSRELLPRGATVILRQCLLDPGGELSEPTDLAARLVGAVEAMSGEAERGARMGREGIEPHLRGLQDLLPGSVTLTVEPSLLKGGVELQQRLAVRVLGPLRAAIRTLMGRAGHAEVLGSLVGEVRIVDVGPGRDPGFSFEDGLLLVLCHPEDGPFGFLAGEELLNALDRVLALYVRAEINRIERESHDFWERILEERFGHPVPVEVAWESFLGHPDEGGYRLYPLNVAEEGVLRLIHALNRWMEEDRAFRVRARRVIRGLSITSARDLDSVRLTLERGILVSRCFADASHRGFPTADAIQMRLLDLLEQRGSREERN